MSRRVLEEKNIRKITKTGITSYSVTLPIEMVRKLKWKQTQKVEFELDEKRERIIIKDWK